MRPPRAGLLAACLFWAPAASAGRIAVTTDARLELAAAAQLLAPDGPRPHGFTAPDLPYSRALKERLARFKDHPAVLMNAEPRMQAFTFSDRSQILLRLSPPPDLAERLTVQYALADRAGGRENMVRWLGSLRDLSKASRFPEVFAQERRKLEPAAARFREREGKQDYLGTLEAYAGLPLIGSYAVHLTPFQLPGGVANAVTERDDGSMEISSVIGPEVQDSGIDFWSRRVPGTLWHESAHGVLDGLGDLFAGTIDRSSAAHASIGWDCYGTWNQCVKEHVVRSVMIRLMARELSEEAAEEQVRFEKEAHYPYLRAILEKLKAYEAQRSVYPTLADYYPRLLEAFPAPPAPAGSAVAPDRSLSDFQRRRTRRLALVVAERAAAPEVRELARRFASAAGETVPGPSPRLEAPAGPSPKGIEAFRAGRFEEALASFDETLRTSPDDVESLMSRGVVLQAMSRASDALASYDRAVALAEAGRGRARGLLPDALSSRASALLDLGERARARADLRRALEVSGAQWPQRALTEARLAAMPEERE